MVQRFLPHGLAVDSQRGAIINAEEETVVPIPLAGSILLQKIVAVKLVINAHIAPITADDRARLIGIGQLKLEHQHK